MITDRNGGPAFCCAAVIEFPLDHRRIAAARAVIRTAEHQDDVTLIEACDVLERSNDRTDKDTAKQMRRTIAPKLAAVINEDTRRMRESDERAPAVIVLISAFWALAMFGAYRALQSFLSLTGQ